MKKLIIGVALVAATFANAETVRIIQRNKDGTSVTNECEAVEYARKVLSDKSARPNSTAWENAPGILIQQVKDAATADAIDKLLSEGYFYLTSTGFAAKYPLLFANYAKVYAETLPEVVPVIESLIADPKSKDGPVKVAVINTYVALWKNQSLADSNVKALLQAAPFGIRHKIRSEGKSFVAKDGINPVQERIDRLSAALNAPRLAGINEAMDECGIRFGLDFTTHLLPQDEVEKLRRDVLNGYDPFTPAIGFKLRTHLGIDEYNKFVKLYNEGE